MELFTSCNNDMEGHDLSVLGRVQQLLVFGTGTCRTEC